MAQSHVDTQPLIEKTKGLAATSAEQPSQVSPRDKRRSWINIGAFVVNFVVVGLSNFGVWGKTNAEVSMEYDTLATPAGYAFSIWGTIFMLESAFVVVQALPQNLGRSNIAQGINYWFATACILQAAWSIAFSQELVILSSALLIGIAASLCMASRGLAPYRKARIPLTEYIFVHAAIGLHAGWTVAAAFVNVNLAFVADGASIGPQVTVALVSLFFMTALAGVFSTVYYDRAFLIAVAWALAGVAANGSPRYQKLDKSVASGLGAAVCILWMSLAMLEGAVFIQRSLKRAA